MMTSPKPGKRKNLIHSASQEVPDTMLIKQREVSTMINQSTTDKLIEMRLTAMADAFRIQMESV